jgi:uncharacterized sulfatase
MHEGGYRVPMIARWPGKVAAGTTSSHPSGSYDFLPTACEIAGAEPPEEIDGISYLPTLLGQHEQQKKHEYLYCASSEGATSVGVRYGKWKLVQYRTKDQAPDWRLYDLSSDIGEAHNVAAKHPEIVEAILKLLNRDGLL